MDLKLSKSIQSRVLSGLGIRSDNFLLLKHYNTFIFTDIEKKQIEENNAKAVVYLYNFELLNMVGAFEPFLDFARNEIGELSDSELDMMIEECGVYSLHKSVFKSFFKTGHCIREEDLLIDEVAFEQDKIASAVVNVVSYLARDRHLIFLLNDIQYASGSTLHFIHNLMEDGRCKNIAVVATYNEAKVSLPHIEPIWDISYTYWCDKECIIDINHGSPIKQKNGINDFEYSSELLDNYINKMNNLLFCLDFSQSQYYLEIIYKMITVEEIEIDIKHKCEIISLYTLVSIYTQDISQALLLCAKLREIRKKYNDLELDYKYYYFMTLAHMYNGKLDEADAYVENCIRIACEQKSDYNIFIAKLLKVMVKMSGWHNIFFCANDISIDEEVIHMAEKYNFQNHLAHIYVYAYDNSPVLFSDETKVDSRLVYFNKGIDIMKKLGNEYFMMEAYRNNIMIASTNGFFKTANYYYDKCREIVSGKDIHEEAMIYNGVGYSSSAMEEYDKALDCYKHALKIFLSLEEIDYVGETLYNMAINCIMAQDYNNAFQYLEMSFNIVKKMKMNSLRVCNISKLSGLLALCSYYNGNELKCSIYTEKTRLFVEHLIYRYDEGSNYDNEIVHDYNMCNDDLFIYYYVYGLQLINRKEYEEALKSFEKAAGCIDEFVGNQFYIFRQYITEMAKLYRLMGKDSDAEIRLKAAIHFYEQHGCNGKVEELNAELENKKYKSVKHKLGISAAVKRNIADVLRHSSVYKENQEQQKRMNFLSSWQKMIEIGDKTKKELVNPSVRAFIHNFNIDKLILVKYDNSDPEVLYNNTGLEFEGDRRIKVEEFFHKNRLGFATSKINNNYIDYIDIVSLFDKTNICSIIGIPFYYNDSLKAIMVAYISMKDNWHSPTNRYLLDDSDYAVFEFLVRQLLSSIDMLEANEKIKHMNDKLNRLAATDKLTGLYNREGFYANISNIIRCNRQADTKQAFGIMYIDLDNFKYYNDTFGHGVGDVILIEMSKIFKQEVGNEGFVTRYGGDEFLITLYTDDYKYIQKLAHSIYSKINDADGFIEIINDKLGRKVDIPKLHQISCSIGISTVSTLTCEDELERVIKEADKVLYDVKKSGKGVYKFYA